MKLTVSKRELLAVCSHVIGSQRQWTPEQAAQRLRAWEELGVSDLALDVADVMMSPGLSLNPNTPYLDRRAMVDVEVSDKTVGFLLAQLALPTETGNADYLTPLVKRLTELRNNP